MLEVFLFVIAAACFLLFLIVTYLYFKAKRDHVSWMNTQNEFMAVMIHDLRAPLAVIRSSADMVLHDSASLTQEQITTMLNQIKVSSTDLLAIVSNLLDISKIEAGKVELLMKDIDMAEFIKKEAQYYKNLAAEKGLQMHVELSEIPTIYCDEEKLKHILHNLLSNAIKYTNDGVISIETKTYKDYIEIAVGDTGDGIPDEAKSKLFNKYAQVLHSPRNKEKGTGLGLVIVKGMVEAHNGRIWIEDNKPRGTKFVFTLPL